MYVKISPDGLVIHFSPSEKSDKIFVNPNAIAKQVNDKVGQYNNDLDWKLEMALLGKGLMWSSKDKRPVEIEEGGPFYCLVIHRERKDPDDPRTGVIIIVPRGSDVPGCTDCLLTKTEKGWVGELDEVFVYNSLGPRSGFTIDHPTLSTPNAPIPDELYSEHGLPLPIRWTVGVEIDREVVDRMFRSRLEHWMDENLPG